MANADATAFDLQAVKYVHAATITLLVHDAIISLGDESRLIWPTKWSILKVLYLMSRYAPFIDTILDVYDYLIPNPGLRACYITSSISCLGAVIGVATSELILFVRTWALFDRSTKLLYGFAALWIGAVTVALWSAGEFVKTLSFGFRPPPLERVVGCNTVNVNPVIFLAFVALLVIELTLVTLTLWKGVQLLRSGLTPFMASFYKTSIFFYIAIFPLTIGNVLVFLIAPPDLSDLLDTLMRVCHSILCCRILLHLRSVNVQSASSSNYRSRGGVFSDIIFAPIVSSHDRSNRGVLVPAELSCITSAEDVGSHELEIRYSETILLDGTLDVNSSTCPDDGKTRVDHVA